MISIICVSNNKKMLEEMLISSLNNQTYKDYELIVVDSVSMHFNSASEALNYGATKASGDLLVFMHHDISLTDNMFLEKLNNYKDLEFGIAGLAGVKDSKKYQVYSKVAIGPDHINAGIEINEVNEAMALDECVLIIKKDEFKGFADLGNTWHFYGVDYSYSCIKENKKVLILPLQIYHLSPGWSLNENYFDVLKNVMAKKYKEYKVIKTCMGFFNNNIFLGIYCFYRKFKIKVKRLIGKK